MNQKGEAVLFFIFFGALLGSTMVIDTKCKKESCQERIQEMRHNYEYHYKDMKEAERQREIYRRSLHYRR